MTDEIKKDNDSGAEAKKADLSVADESKDAVDDTKTEPKAEVKANVTDKADVSKNVDTVSVPKVAEGSSVKVDAETGVKASVETSDVTNTNVAEAKSEVEGGASQDSTANGSDEVAKEPEKLTILGMFNPAKGRASLMRLIVLLGIIVVVVAIAVAPAFQPKPAATVNGVRIEEKTITDYIVDYREKQSLTSDEDWAKFLNNNSKTVEEFRSDIIDYFVQRELIRQGAEEKGAKTDSASVDELYDSVRNNFSDEQSWNDALSEAGLTEDSYRKELEFVSLQQKLGEKLREEKDDNSELEQTELDSAKSYAQSYDGAKKSSHILFNSEDEETAKSVLEQLRAGTLSWDDAVQQYTTDSASKDDGGNVGWDKMTSFVEAYTNGLANLQKDEISDLVTSDYGIHIIKCTDVFNAPEEITSLDQLPEDWREDIVKNAEQSYDYQLLNDWLQEKKDGSTIEKTDMPSGLSYYVNVDDYKSDTSSSTDSSSSDSSDNSSGSDSNSSEGNENSDNTASDVASDATSADEAQTEADTNTLESEASAQ